MGGVNEGLLIINKPVGPTSFDIVTRVRRELHVKKAGHCGTLDPAAGGVLLIVLGRATRLVEYTTRYRKKYEAIVRLGVSTDTDDGEGEPIGESRVPEIGINELSETLTDFTGEIEQRVPVYSAVKIGGERLYKKARRGDEVEAPLRKAMVYGIELLELNIPEITISVECAGGTYIRALARDIGEKLGCGAHLGKLTRTGAGPYGLDAACGLENVNGLDGSERCFVPFDEMLPGLPSVELDFDDATEISYGRYLGVREGMEQGLVKLYYGSVLIAAAFADSEGIKPEKVFIGMGDLR